MRIRKYIMSVSQIAVSAGVMGTAFYRNVFTPDGSAFLWAAFISAGRTMAGGIDEFATKYNEQPPVADNAVPLRNIRVDPGAPPNTPRENSTRYRDLVSTPRSRERSMSL